MNIRTRVLPPAPAKTIEGLRDTGYSFETAIADILDNSITAGATRVAIRLSGTPGGDLVVAIADNGAGMDEDGLFNAMQYGSEQRANKFSLSKFGLGLKTASTAFCRKLTVLSRSVSDLEARQLSWDLDHVASVGEWEVLIEDPTDSYVSFLESVAQGGSGTAVIWTKIDRFFERDYRYPGAMAKALAEATDGLKEHLSATYHRFLDDEDGRAPTVEMTLNGVSLQPWDPLGKTLPGVELAAEATKAVIVASSAKAEFKLRAVVLPRAQDLSKDQRDEARLTVHNQGFWVYRENRIILHGTWFRLFAVEPHYTLLRVALDFEADLDDYFAIDVKKSQLNLHSAIREYLKSQFLSAPRQAANDRYRKGRNADIDMVAGGMHGGSDKLLAGREEELKAATVTPIGPNRATVTNGQGSLDLKLLIDSPGAHGEVMVKPVDGIDDGLLWEPALIDTHHGVRLNTKHPYYQRLYIPNRDSGVLIQSLDSLMWALAEAELAAISKESRTNMLEMRFQVSRILRRLAEDMPELSDSDLESAV